MNDTARLLLLSLFAFAACGESETKTPDSVEHARKADDAVGDIAPRSVSVGGRQVIDEEGNWVGPSSLTTGAGLVQEGNVLRADTGVLQARIEPCPAGTALRSVDGEGQPTCEAIPDTSGLQCPAGSALRSVDGEGQPTCEPIQDPRFGSPNVGDGAGSGQGGTCLIGEVRLFAGNFAPVGFMVADGRELRIVDNTALFSLIGAVYGGNGEKTFALPDLRALAPAGVSYVICGSGVFPARE